MGDYWKAGTGEFEQDWKTDRPKMGAPGRRLNPVETTNVFCEKKSWQRKNKETDYKLAIRAKEGMGM
jgi:hypothetical protein